MLTRLFRISPLVLDLTGAGITLSGISQTSPYFDLAGTGFARKTGWIGAGTGLLCIDKNGDGQINDITELFGQSGAFADGFAAPRALDSNHDGVIDARDAAFSQLRVWVNPELDGIVHPGELLTLAQLGIISISLTTIASTTSIAGNDVRLIASTTLADGTTREIADVWFANSPTYMRRDTPTAVSTAVSTAAAALPGLSGYGLMRDLRSAATLDANVLADAWACGLASDLGRERGFPRRGRSAWRRWGIVNNGAKFGLRNSLFPQYAGSGVQGG